MKSTEYEVYEKTTKSIIIVITMPQHFKLNLEIVSTIFSFLNEIRCNMKNKIINKIDT